MNAREFGNQGSLEILEVTVHHQEKKAMSMGESGNQGDMKLLGHNDRQSIG